MNFNGKIAVVTGGGSGIGRSCALGFATHGAGVAILDRDQKNGAAVAAEIQAAGGRAAFFQVDLGVPEQVEQAVEKVVAEFGGIDVLAHSAGIQTYGTATTTSLETWQRTMNSTVDSAFLIAKSVVPAMILRGGGSIVMVGSVQSVAAHSNSTAYVTAKHAVLGLVRCLAVDFAKNNIRANCVLPGAIDTPMLRWSASLNDDPQKVMDACASLSMMNRVGRPEEIANVVLFAASDLASFMTGSVLVADGGLLTPIGGAGFQNSPLGKED